MMWFWGALSCYLMGFVLAANGDIVFAVLMVWTAFRCEMQALADEVGR